MLRFLFLIWLFCALAIRGNAQEKDILGGYALKHTVEYEHFTIQGVKSITQTKDGFVWIATYNGLMRNEGKNYKILNKQNNPSFQSNQFYHIKETEDSAMWFATQNGVILKHHNRWRSFTLSDDKKPLGTCFFIAKDYLGKMWLATDKGVFCMGKDSVFTQKGLPHILTSKGVSSIRVDNKRNIWFSTFGYGLVKMQPDKRIETFDAKNGLQSDHIVDILWDKKGYMWILSNRGVDILHLQDKKIQSANEIYQIPRGTTRSACIYQSADETIWIGGDKWFGTIQKNELFKAMPQVQGEVNVIFEDKERNIWVGTDREGFMQLAPSKFNVFINESLVRDVVCYASTHYNGQLLVATKRGIFSMKKGEKAKPFPLKKIPQDTEVRYIFVDKQNFLWLATSKGVLLIKNNGEEVLFNTQNGLSYDYARVLCQDNDGAIWVGTSEGLNKIVDEKIVKIVSIEDGLENNFILGLHSDKNNNLWIGTRFGLAKYSKGKIQTFLEKDGLPSSLAFKVVEDSEGNLWVMMNGGIARIKNDKITAITSGMNNVPTTIFDFIEDNKKNVWLTSNEGLYHTSLKQLQDFVDRKVPRLKSHHYTEHDGLYTKAMVANARNYKDSLGGLWFATSKGLAYVNPNQIKTNTLSPPVNITQVLIDDVPADFSKPILFTSQKKRLTISFDAQSYIAPNKVIFQYALEGFDEDWITTSSERQVSYTSLPHGKYLFRVIACNNDGIWNVNGASFIIIVKPAWWETWGARISFVLLLMGLVWFFAHIRILSEKRQKEKLEEIVKKRTHEIAQKNILIEERTRSLTDSIRYAQRIQIAILPFEERIRKAFSEFFALYIPRDIVSGDFYWFQERNKKSIIIAGDCTGHGVPGAFMSMIADSLLNNIVLDKGITRPDLILNEMHKGIRKALQQDKTNNQDGMDAAICVVDWDKKLLLYSGAKNPLYYVQEEKMHIIKADKLSIGGYRLQGENSQERFTLHLVDASIPLIFYIFTDGYEDQFGGEQNRKFMARRFRELLFSIHTLDMEEQKAILEKTIREWMGESQKQIDDILVVGVRLNLQFQEKTS